MKGSMPCVVCCLKYGLTAPDASEALRRCRRIGAFGTSGCACLRRSLYTIGPVTPAMPCGPSLHVSRDALAEQIQSRRTVTFQSVIDGYQKGEIEMATDKQQGQARRLMESGVASSAIVEDGVV